VAARKKREQVLPKRFPLERPDYTEAELWALRAVHRGEANPAQQKAAIDYLIRRVCETFDMPYRPDSQRDTDFALGKMFVGQSIVWLCQYAPTKVDEDERAARAAGRETTDV
jgi:hypothetical protein